MTISAKLGVWTIVGVLLLGVHHANAVVLPSGNSDNARIEIPDSTGGLSWNGSALTVACWVKISIPSGTSLSQNMTILANRRTGDWNQPYAYRIYFNINTGNIEFTSRGTGGVLSPIILVARPYLDRWYHLAVARSGDQFIPYVDGRALPTVTPATSVGDSKNTDGVSIGGFQTAERFWGEIQEAVVYQQRLDRNIIAANMFRDTPADSEGLKAYFKLGYSSTASDNLKNFAATPPAGTETAQKQGAGTLDFPETDRQGEQSLFDSRKNQGMDAVASLSGVFSWSQTAIARPTPGIPFEFAFGYSSGNAFSGQSLEDGVNVYDEDRVLSSGWRHSFLTRLVPGDLYFKGAGNLIGLLSWEGSLDAWQLVEGTKSYNPLHGEYRGEMRVLDDLTAIEWTTPDRLVYRFIHPSFGSNSLTRGKLTQIRDFNGNTISLTYNANTGRLSTVTDTAGGVWNFTYNPQGLLITVTGPSEDASAKWTISFAYDGQNRLTSKAISGPSQYATLPSTTWQFGYATVGTISLLETITDPRGKPDTRIAYDTYGRKTNVRDANGRTVQFEYNKPALRQLTTTALHGGDATKNRAVVDTFDRKLRLLTSKDPLGHVTTNRYDAAGNVIKTIDPRRFHTKMTYDARSNVLSVRNPLGEVTRWEYNRALPDGTALNQPTKEISPIGWENRFTYDDGGNLLTHSDDLGTLARHEYDARGLVTSIKDGNGHETTFTYYGNGFLATKTTATGTDKAGTWIYTRSELGWLLFEKNPDGYTATSGYNVNGQIVRLTDPIRTFTKNYDADGNLLSESDGNGKLTTYGYDDADQQVSRTDRNGQTWDFGYSSFGELTSTTAPAAVSDGTSQRDTVTRTFDNGGRLVRETDPYRDFVSYEYDENDNCTATIDKLSKRWTRTYDALNRTVAERDPEGNVSETRFDHAGRVKVIISPSRFPSLHDYDDRGRLTTWKDPEGFDWIYAYDGVENILDITDANQGHYTMTYGPRNERLTEKNQDGQTWGYTYDTMGRLTRQVDPNGTTRDLAYDAVSRLESVKFNTGRENTLAYDNNDNIRFLSRTQSGSPSTTLQFDYDVLDRVIESRDTFSKTVGYGYDALGRITSKAYPGGRTLTQGFDRLGRLKSLSFAGGAGAPLLCEFSCDKAGRLTGRTYPNGIAQTNGFDTAGRLTGLEYKNDITSLIALTYAYDQNGNKTGGNETGTLDWNEDTLGAYDERTNFTPAGKLIDRVDTGGRFPRNYTYDYDESGNMVHAAGPGQDYRLTYDEDNRTTSISWETGLASKEILNRYDALGRRVSRTLDSVETRYVLDLTGDMERILCDTDTKGVIQAWYVHGPDLCFKVDNTSALTCYHSDAMGNIVRTTAEHAATISEYAYTPYGRALATNGTTNNPYRFVGSQGVMEELPNLLFMRARYYSADAGAFLSLDPIRPLGAKNALDFFTYSKGSPLNFNDPKGEYAITVVSALASSIAESASIHYDILVLNKSVTVQEVLARQTAAIASGAAKGALIEYAGLTGFGAFASEGLVNFGEEAIKDALDRDDFDFEEYPETHLSRTRLLDLAVSLVIREGKLRDNLLKYAVKTTVKKTAAKIGSSTLKSAIKGVGEKMSVSKAYNEAASLMPSSPHLLAQKQILCPLEDRLTTPLSMATLSLPLQRRMARQFRNSCLTIRRSRMPIRSMRVQNLR